MDGNHLKPLLERLTPHCAAVLEASAGFAVTRGHYEVTVEHVVLKLLEAGGGDFGRLLEACGVDLDALWQGMLENLARQRAGNRGKPAFSVPLAQWLEKAWLASTLHYGGDRIHSAALLDALLELGPYLPGKAFTPLEAISPSELRRRFSALSAGSAKEVGGTPSSPKGAEGGRSEEISALSQFTINLTARAAAGEIDPVLGRSDEIRQAVDILTRRRKNNPILVGEPGVGKTAVVEGLALRIAAGEVPEPLLGVRLLTLDLGLLQAGAGVKGEFEKRLKNVIEEVKASAVPVILFVDEAHTLIGAGGEAGQGDAANLMKPALARGELRTVAATTWSEYKKYFERDAALARRFQPVKVQEPSPDAAVGMLSGLRSLYQKHHGVLITDSAVEAAVRLSHRYITGRQLPDKAIDLLDTAAARVRMGQSATPARIEALRERIRYLEGRLAHLSEDKAQALAVDERLRETLQQERDEAARGLSEQESLWQREREALGVLKSQETGESVDLDVARAHLREVQGETPLLRAEVDADAVAEVVADWTGIPVGRMVRDDLAALVRFEETVGGRIVGQDGALAVIGRSVRAARAGLGRSDSPLGVFLLAGPTGVGKTETARALAETLFGGERFLVTINMSEYQEAHSVAQLKGSPPGYVGYGEGGILTEAVRQRPYAVLLLDEVEKAHPDVMNLFYQVFDRGFMRDGEGREIDFKNTVILMTTNLGAEEIVWRTTPPESPEEPWEAPGWSEMVETVRPAVLRHFAPALAARMQIVPFLPLEEESLRQIVALKLDALAGRLIEIHGMEVRCRPEVLEHLAARCRRSSTGARMINDLVEQQLVPGIAQSLLQFMADEDMPDILSLEVDEEGELSCLFADRSEEVEEVLEKVAS